MAGLWRTAFDPRVSDHLISDEGEIVVDEVRRHPMAFLGPGVISFFGVLIMISTIWVPVAVAWLPMIIGLLLVITGGFKMLAAHMDRFVITNMRVFRVHGIFSQHTATMPMSRILDISVHKPFLGRILNYGHFVFESAAENQGLRDIRFVARPDQRDLTIQRVIQRSGLRTSMRPLGGYPSAHSSPATPDVPGREIGPDADDAARGDGIGDDEVSNQPGDPITGEQVAGRQLSDEEWLAGGWSERDAADYRSSAPDTQGASHDGLRDNDRS
ncbi:PH domain-containing protein [Microlunatus sp. Gsoil 973]|jgi:hypothetical protein|uniref:PH domain-containing protein n=1 Tax=Microlunatus sp. Gsoil 973 TaxID=2672569 RepID=UPI0012B44B49|nr:PH domain-containing protein [Microlunatus sp. Gsoil 973]